MRDRVAAALVRLVAALVPARMDRALRTRTGGVWGQLEAPVPAGGAVVVANHHSWWDAYLAWGLAVHHGRATGAVMDDAQLDRFRFFTHLGAVPASRPRAAARHAAAGAWLVVFPEGRLRPAGPLGPTRAGAAAIARWAGVPVWPVAFRAVVRGGEHPELYVRGGALLPAGSDAAAADASLAALLGRLDADLAAAADPEGPVPGYEAWWQGRARTDERAGWVARLWGGGPGRRQGEST
ncbi:MAG: 1-acyl-sn-glycerol-3-phosphate acyltransferase [Trueperaceae bacterium]